MRTEEIANITIAVLMLFVVASLGFIFEGAYSFLPQVLLFSLILILASVFVKKWAAYLLDANVEHKVWHLYRFGILPRAHFKKEMPFGIVVPLIVSVVTLGIVKPMMFLTYEARALKRRAAKRFGFYSYTEITDWHNALIGAAGIVAVLLISLFSYLPGFEYLAKMSAYYALSNILPLSDLDGTQIFFGSKIIWAVLAFISLIFAFFAFALL